MNYDFTTVSKRFGIGSAKWDEIDKYLPNNKEDIVPFSVADMEFRNPPEVKKALIDYIEKYPIGYVNVPNSYREAVCSWEERRHDWKIKPEWIFTTPGIISALYDAVNTYTKPKEKVILMTPSYYPMYHAIEDTGRVIAENKLIFENNRYTIDFDNFEKQAKDSKTTLFLMCNPHNPSSRVFTKEELMKINKICLENNVFVCADEIHNDLIMKGYKHTVFATLSEEASQNCMICVAASKTFNLAGCETSSIIIPNDDKRKMFIDYQHTGALNPRANNLGLLATETAYNEDEEWLKECLKVLEKNLSVINAYFEKELPQLKVIKTEGTYLVWMDFRAVNLDYKELGQILRVKGKMFFDDGYLFGKAGEKFERWNISCPTRYIEEALPRLKETLLPYLK